jgi:hypothetical protein
MNNKTAGEPGGFVVQFSGRIYPRALLFENYNTIIIII